jgi:hypothetical protein
VQADNRIFGQVLAQCRNSVIGEHCARALEHRIFASHAAHGPSKPSYVFDFYLNGGQGQRRKTSVTA